MKLYYIFSADCGYDLAEISDYKFAGSADKGYLIIKFDVSQIERVVKLYGSFLRKSSYINYSKINGYLFFGANGYIYNYYESKLVNTEITGFKSFITVLYLSAIRYKKILKTCKRSVQFEESAIIKNSSVLTYNAYEFFCKEQNITFKYRLKRAKGENKPILIYMAGGASLGYDNIKQLFECLFLLHRQLKRYDCNILIPQQPCASYTVSPTGSEYLDAVRQLVDLVCDEVNADRNRVYLTGSSGGGWSTWELIYRYPDYFACGLPVMGTFINHHKEIIHFENFLNTPLWVAHSSDDDNVVIDSDDYCVEELKKIGAEVRYTRWEKYGHKMHSRFYKNEPWAEWMFKQVKK